MKKLSLLALAVATQVLLSTAAQAQTVMMAAPGQPYCREYTQIVKIGSTQQKGYGTACLQPDGTWQMTPAAAPVVVQPAPPPQNTTYIIRENPVVYGPPPAIVDVVVGGGGYHRHYWHGGW